MAGDYSRVRFDPLRDFAAVLKQQGRVDLDGDANEHSEILQRRWRAETVDVMGRCVVPRETPDGFSIRISGTSTNKQMEIGPGRMYVHGLLAENHGAAPFSFDLGTLGPDGRPVGVLGELVGEQFLRYEDQPYQGSLPEYSEGNGPHLVYLDVWHREVTATQDTGLLEEALGGVDTTTRLQTVWQVRFLPEDIPRSMNCATPDAEIPGWTELTQTTAARLSTFTNEEEQPDDPCLLPPSGGYRGLENQLYRIEIHDPGVAGEGATFKWSRDNASVTTRILEFLGPSRIRVATLGRDEVLGFAVGNWVEVTDDQRELDGQPGQMLQVVEINPDTQEITLSADLADDDLTPSGQADDTPEERHSRLIRWDQRGAVFDAEGNELVDLDSENSGGVIPVPAEGTRIQLEYGIEVAFNFDPADGVARSGDYWCFAARTASATIEELEDAPPRGIHHHYCRLAIVRWPLAALPNVLPPVLDCRTFWPPQDVGGDDCACTVCVTAESHNSGTLTIQQAISQVTGIGGTVCLGPGEFFLGETPLTITGREWLTLIGRGPGTMLLYPGQEGDPPPAITVEDSWGVKIKDLSVVTLASRNASAIEVRTSGSVDIHNCVFLQLPPGDSSRPMIAIGGGVLDLSIHDNWIVAGVGMQGVLGGSDAASPGVPSIVTAGLFICKNILFCNVFGIILDSLVVSAGVTVIGDNYIDGPIIPIRTVGVVADDSPVDISRNTIRTNGDGIVVAVDNARVTDNNITAINPGQGGNGIVLTDASANEGGVDRCQVLGNRITRLGGVGILINTHLRSAMIKQNFIDSVLGGGITMGAEGSAGDLTIENNHIHNVASFNPDTGETLAGIRIVDAQNVALVGNTIDGVGVRAIGNPSRAGIQVGACPSARISGNELVHIGPAESGGPGVVQIGGITTGIDVVGPFDRVDMTDNSVRRSAAVPENPDPSSWFAVRIRPVGNQFQATDLLTFVPADTAGNVLRLSPFRLVFLPRGRETVAIRGNRLESHDSTASLVSVSGQGTCVFTDNRCITSFSSGGDFSPADVSVVLVVSRAMVGSNYVEGPIGVTPIRLIPPSGEQDFFTVLGNLTSGAIQIGNGPLPDRWAGLNVSAL